MSVRRFGDIFGFRLAAYINRPTIYVDGRLFHFVKEVRTVLVARAVR